jgi:hypothetical protein
LNETSWTAFAVGTTPTLTIDTILTAGDYPVFANKPFNTDGYTLTVNSGANLDFESGAKYTGAGSIVINDGGVLHDLQSNANGIWDRSGSAVTGSIVINYGAKAYIGPLASPILYIGKYSDSPSMVSLYSGSSLTMKANGYVVSGTIGINGDFVLDGPGSNDLNAPVVTLTGVNSANVKISQGINFGFNNKDCILGVSDAPGVTINYPTLIDTTVERELIWNDTTKKWSISPP